MRPARPVTMWAAIVKTQAGNEWIHSGCIRPTRREAHSAYTALWMPEERKRALQTVRFARVVVALADTGSNGNG